MKNNEFFQVVNKVITICSEITRVQCDDIIKNNRVGNVMGGNPHCEEMYCTKYDAVLIIPDNVDPQRQIELSNRLNHEFENSGVFIKFFRLASQVTDYFSNEWLTVFVSNIEEDED